MQMFRSLRDWARLFWWMVRQISGDAAYENYLRSGVTQLRGDAAKNQPMSPEKFYEDSLRRRYSQASRCC